MIVSVVVVLIGDDIEANSTKNRTILTQYCNAMHHVAVTTVSNVLWRARKLWRFFSSWFHVVSDAMYGR